MPIEPANFISDLNSSNPGSAESAAQGDDHLRLIKATLKATFPTITGAITLSHTQINALDGRITRFEQAFTSNGAIKAAGDIDLGGHKSVNQAPPTDQTDGATKAYVDTKAQLPVGYILLTTINVNPGVTTAGGLGYGTWTLRGVGSVIVGVGTGTDKNGLTKAFTAGANVGEYAHKIVTSELPAGVVTNVGLGAFAGGDSDPFGVDQTLTVTKTPAATAMPIMPPSFGAYIWERTA